MKKIALLSLAVCILVGCKKADNKNACGIPEYSISVDGQKATIVTKNREGEKFGFVRVDYGANGFLYDKGFKANVPDTLVLDYLVNGTYDVYVQGNCGGDTWTEVAGPKSFIVTNGKYVNPNCLRPENIEFFDYNLDDLLLKWTVYDANYCEVAYGLQGFNPDTARHYFVNGTQMNGFVLNGLSTYDFYVRANCASNGFSEWSGVRTMEAKKSYNFCGVPNNFFWYMDNTTKKVTANWNSGSSSSWEIVYNKVENNSTGPNAVANTTSVSKATIQTSGLAQKIYVFIRTRCTNVDSGWYNDSIVIQ